MEKFVQSLRRMAAVDQSTEGQWSADTANERCAEYARLVSRIFGSEV